MRWKDGRRSSNIEDRRGESPAMGAAAAPIILRFLPLLMRSKGGRILLIVGAIAVFGGKMIGIDVLALLAGSAPMATTQKPAQMSAAEQELADFSAVVLGDTETTWNRIFTNMNQRYQEPTLVLFSNQVSSACGQASAAVGPFYCPADQKLYLDLSFFNDLHTRFGAPGDFAQAYVIAHEVGHHVQTLLGISNKVRQAQQGQNEAARNALSVRQELQADCFAGIWGHAAANRRNLLETGDLDEALQAATAIGDDRLQKQAGRSVVPDSFTHGTSAQRVRWFRTGFDSGDISQCDTFSAKQL